MIRLVLRPLLNLYPEVQTPGRIGLDESIDGQYQMLVCARGEKCDLFLASLGDDSGLPGRITIRVLLHVPLIISPFLGFAGCP